MIQRLLDWGKTLLIAAVCTIVTFLLVDCLAGHSSKSSGIVKEKIFIRERVYVTYTTERDPNGSSYMVPHVNRDPPEWILIVDSFEGILHVNARPDIYYALQEGQEVRFGTWSGKWTGLPYFREAL